jgi:tetratricopeptide (TPR) repeat protein
VTPLFLLAGAALASSPHWKPNDEALHAYDRGVEQLEASRLEQAGRSFRQALDRDPDCGACQHALGLTLLRQDDAEEAVELLQELARTHPARAEVMVSLADAAFGSQDFALSIEAASIALVLDATRWDALTSMVRACLRTGELATARRWMDSASGAHPDDRLACLEADLLVEERSLDAAQAALDKCERSGDDDLIAHARVRLAAATGDYTALSSQASSRGDRDLSRLSDAFASHDAGEHRRAATLLRQVLAETPANAEAALLLGLSEHALGHSERAEEALARAFEGEAWIEVGRDGSFRGVVTSEGARIFEERLRQGVGLLVMLQVQRGALDEAQASLDRAKEELGPCAETDAGRIALLAARGEIEAASVTASRALADWPDVPLLDDTVRELLLNHAGSRTDALLQAATDAGLAAGGYWRALADRDTGDPVSCLSSLQPALSTADEAELPTVATLAWACAVEAGELDSADRYRLSLRELGAAADPDVSLNHARLLLAHGEHEPALALLDELALEREDRVRYARELELTADIGLGRLDDALAVLQTTPVSAELRFELALALLRAERIDEALPLLGGCCEGLQDVAHRTRCGELLEQVEGVVGAPG